MTRRREPLREPAAEARLFRRRTAMVWLIMALAGAALLSRLVHLQVLEYERYAAASRSNRVKVQVVTPPRGLIYDRTGVLLAENRASYRLEVMPEGTPDLDATLAALGAVVTFEAQDRERIAAARRRQRPFEPLVVRRFLSDEEAAVFAVHRHRFPGVDLAGELSRHYPLGALTAHAVGYVGRVSEAELATASAEQRASNTIGKIGVERSYDAPLQGRVGYEHVEVDAHGRRLRVLLREPPTPGPGLRLTLDVRLQAAAARALGANAGAVVALDPRDGAVRVLLSWPSFDPNAFVGGLSMAEYRALAGAPGNPLVNRALRGEYPPGSTIKPFAALAGLHTGLVTTASRVYCPGAFRLPGVRRPYRCWRAGGHGTVDLRAAVSRSCDVYFYDLAYRMGMQRLHDELAGFGLGQATGIDLSGERSGLLPSPGWKRAARGQPWYPGETVIAGIGQGYMLATPLQLAVATAVVATRGVRRVPHLARATPPPPRGVLQAAPEAWTAVQQAMEEVVHGAGGTARGSALGAAYRYAGKTGTAQVYALPADPRARGRARPKHLEDHALFIAYAPAVAPELVVAVVVEHGGGGSTAAAPVARQVLDAAFAPHEDVAPEPSSDVSAVAPDRPPGGRR
jgi:penicillin-binding protein 2